MDDFLVLTKRDFKNINKQINRKPYPMPNINKMLLKLDCFQYTKILSYPTKRE